MSRKTSDGRRARDGGKCRIGVTGGAGLMALILKDAGDKLANILFIVDDENVGCH